MKQRFVVIAFPWLVTDRYAVRQPRLKKIPFVITTTDHGRVIVAHANPHSEKEGIYPGMTMADARAICPGIEKQDEIPGLSSRLLQHIAEWLIRFTPFAAVDGDNGIILDATGCPHLWGGEEPYLIAIRERLAEKGYQTRLAIADTIGAAWALAHFDKDSQVVHGNAASAILHLPVSALRIDQEAAILLYKLGIKKVDDLLRLPSSAIRRRFGNGVNMRISQATGRMEEYIKPVCPPASYEERLPCIEPIRTAAGISIALQRTLTALCDRLQREGKGALQLQFRCYDADNHLQVLDMDTYRPTHHAAHLQRLMEMKIPFLSPGAGIELFILQATRVEEVSPVQGSMWNQRVGLENDALAELLDRFRVRWGAATIHRYLPDAHYWPERSCKPATSLEEKTDIPWWPERPRPVQLLASPEKIEVTAPVPDYPPMNFRYRGTLHTIKKADGPERIEQEWWIAEGQHRDYYYVEDEEGKRYWLFRLGHYHDAAYQWYLHGFFA